MPLPSLIEIVPLEKPVHAEITVPGSKSITNRALILAALAEGEVTLQGALWSEDTQIMVECLQELGFMVNLAPDPDEPCNRTITVYGKGGAVPPGGTEQQPLDLFVGNAGTAARFLSAFVCLGSGVYRLHGVPRMHERPQAALFKALRELGYRVESENGNEKLPVRIFGSGTGVLPVRTETHRRDARATCTVSIEESSQFASALLLCAKTGNWEIKIKGENAEESPYVAMTLELITVFPKQGGYFSIEGDASSGSYFIGASWLSLLGNPVDAPIVSIRNWPTSGWQVDQKFSPSRYSSQMREETLHSEMILGFTSQFSRESDLGDSIMTAIVLAPFSKRFTDVTAIRFLKLGRLRIQECDRVVALYTELRKCGVDIKMENQGEILVVPLGAAELHGAEIETYNDHRMAMCFAILGLKVPGIKLKNPACVKKTFPNFFQKLAAAPPHGLGAKILDGKTGRPLSHEELFAD